MSALPREIGSALARAGFGMVAGADRVDSWAQQRIAAAVENPLRAGHVTFLDPLASSRQRAISGRLSTSEHVFGN